MENKRIIEILHLMRIEFIKEDEENRMRYSNFGMCAMLVELLLPYKQITLLEKDFMITFLFANLPTEQNEFKKFTQVDIWLDPLNMQGHWWVTKFSHPRGNLIRVEYLTALIDKLSK